MTPPPASLHQHRDVRGLHTRRHCPSRSGRRRGRIHPAVRRHLPSRSGRRQGRIHPAARWHPNHHLPRCHRPGPVWGRQDVHDLPLRLPGYRDQRPQGAGISDDMDRGFTDRKNLLMDRRTMAPKIDDLSFLLEVPTLRSFLVPHVVGGLHF
ncbi:uncharacterized protein LOC119356171 [Triticum dicoccoides]|uniref:uncharacterized protein LOC119356171 n=1 Tax=Triticum dicoccoides TaxID=85692 RepID=UPI00188F8B1F|nr:uncharacterized protein LOC119356171 [Triticum dicoccoides]